MGRGDCLDILVNRVLRGVILALLTLFNSCYNTFEIPPHKETLPEEANITIAELHTLYEDSNIRLFTQDWRVRGVITANNIEGNLYGSFILEDNSYAIEILDGLTASQIRHAQGATILIHLDGLAMSRSRGVLQVGLPAADYSLYALDYISSIALVDSHIKIEGNMEAYQAPTVNASELSEQMCGRVVSVINLRPTFEEDEFNSSIKLNGYNAFIDSSSSTIIYTYVSSYADFANRPLEGNLFNITGVVQQGAVNGSMHYILKPCKSDDIAAI